MVMFRILVILALKINKTIEAHPCVDKLSLGPYPPGPLDRLAGRLRSRRSGLISRVNLRSIAGSYATNGSRSISSCSAASAAAQTIACTINGSADRVAGVVDDPADSSAHAGRNPANSTADARGHAANCSANAGGNATYGSANARCYTADGRARSPDNPANSSARAIDNARDAGADALDNGAEELAGSNNQSQASGVTCIFK